MARGREIFEGTWRKAGRSYIAGCIVVLGVGCATDAGAETETSLPPAVQIDRHYREANLRFSRGDYYGAARSMVDVLRLAQSHEDVELPNSYWFDHARIHEKVNELATARESVTRYLRAEERDGEHYADALELLIDLEERLPAWQRRNDLEAEADATLFNQLELAAQPALVDELRSGGQGPEMVLVGAGFVPRRDSYYHLSPDETQLVGPVYVARYETTVAHFARFVEDAEYRTEAVRLRNNGCSVLPDSLGEAWADRVKGKSRRHWRAPGFMQTERHPVVCVSMADARAYTQWLSNQTGASYRLPTEAEWLLAARAGTMAATELARDRRMLQSWIHPDALEGQYTGDSCFRVRDAYCGPGGVDYWEPAGEATRVVGESGDNEIHLSGLWGNVSELTERCGGMPPEFGSPDREECMAMGGSFRLPYRVGLTVRPYVSRFGRAIPNNSADVGFRVVRDAD